MLQGRGCQFAIPRFRHVAIPKCPDACLTNTGQEVLGCCVTRFQGSQRPESGCTPFAHVGSSVVISVKDGASIHAFPDACVNGDSLSVGGGTSSAQELQFPPPLPYGSVDG